MIIDAKVIMGPTSPSHLRSPTSYTTSGAQMRPTLTSLPAHIILEIIHYTFPPLPSSNSPSGQWTPSPPSFAQIQHQLYQPTIPERQRKTLLWLSNHLRLVSRTLYTACMHVLRSTYLPAYLELIRPPYTSDPFPIGLPTTADSTVGSRSRGGVMQSAGPPAYSAAPTPTFPSESASIRSISTTATRATSHHHHHRHDSHSHSPLISPHRETVILDRFILLKVQQDVFLDDTELHTDRADAYRDIFDVAQPKARLEDLVRVCGVREGVVSVPGWDDDILGDSGNMGWRQTRTERGGEERGMGNEQARSQPTNWAKGVINFDGSTDSSSNSSSCASLPMFSPTSPSVGTRPESFLSTHTTTHTSTTQSSSSSASVHNHPLIPSPPAKSRTLRSLFFRGTPAPKKKITSSTYTRSPPPSPPPEPPRNQPPPLPFSSLSIAFSPRRVGLVYNRTKTIVEVSRTPGQRGAPGQESLEFLAFALVDKLKVALGDGSVRV